MSGIKRYSRRSRHNKANRTAKTIRRHEKPNRAARRLHRAMAQDAIKQQSLIAAAAEVVDTVTGEDMDQLEREVAK